VTFQLNREEYALYKAVTAYINQFLPQASGRKKQPALGPVQGASRSPARCSSAGWPRRPTRFTSRCAAASRSRPTFSERRYTFQQFYAVFINGTYARPYLRRLAETDAPERDGPQLQAETARKILAWLRLSGLTPSAIPGAEYLTIYCLYRWASFGRGYLFERIVIEDLRAAGIVLAAHAPQHGRERYTASDLSIIGLGDGDVKSSLYFLDDLADPQSNFYITRLHDAESRAIRQVVLMTPQGWRQLDGEPRPAAIAQAGRYLPRPVLVEAAGRAWVMVEYAVWKDRVLRWQSRRRPK